MPFDLLAKYGIQDGIFVIISFIYYFRNNCQNEKSLAR